MQKSRSISSLGGTGLEADTMLRCLLVWTKSLLTEGGVSMDCESVHDIEDGVVCGEALHQIIPQFYTEEKLNKLQRDVGSNSRLKIGNIRKLKRELQDFYESRVQNDELSHFEEAKVAEGEVWEVITLLELLLGCALHCDDKQKHIMKIMSLEESVQKTLMVVVQKLMVATSTRETDATPGADELSPEQIRQLVAAKDELSQLYHDLKVKHDETVQQTEDAQAKIDDLEKRLKSVPTQENGLDTGTNAGRLEQQLHSTKAAMEEYKHTLDHERSEHADALQEQNQIMAELRRQLERSEQEAALVSRMKDEMEELREKEMILSAVEKKNEMYRKRIAGYEEVQTEAVLIKKNSSAQLQRIAMLEETERRALSLQQQITQQNAKYRELESQLLEETKRGDALLVETKSLKEEVQDLTNENHRFSNEKRQLTAKVRELEDGASDGDMYGSSLAALASLKADGGSSDADLEKIAKLEAENAILKANSAGGSELQAIVDDLADRKAKLETDNRSKNLQVLELQAKLDKLNKKAIKSTDDRAIEQLAVAERELDKFRKKATELETLLQSTQEELLALRKKESLMGLDQKTLVAKVEEEVRVELRSQIEALEKQANDAQAEVVRIQEELDTTQEHLGAIEIKLDKAIEQKEEKTEQLTHVLMEKSMLQTKLSETVAETSDKLREQEKAFRESTAETEKRLRESMGKELGGSSKEHVLELQLKLTTMEKDLMSFQAQAEREKMQVLSPLQEKVRTLESDNTNLKAKVSRNAEQRERFMQASKQGENLSVSIKTLQNQLEEKKKEFDTMKRSKERLESQHKREQHLMVSAWNTLGLRYQRLSAEQTGSHSTGSFMAKQRNASMSTPRK
eukprot:m.27076 g.27076  ORF g.27076 m.27076 type:complete len:859 (-) comp15668_c0_seq1:263-2839(-)